MKNLLMKKDLGPMILDASHRMKKPGLEDLGGEVNVIGERKPFVLVCTVNLRFNNHQFFSGQPNF